MTTYMENFLESVSNLPHDIKRNFTEMRELDQRVQNILVKQEGRTKQYLRKKKLQQNGSGNVSQKELDEELTEIRANFKKAEEFTDRKVTLAQQSYETMDKHIRKLDSDLRKFEEDLEQEESVKNGTITKGSSTNNINSNSFSNNNNNSHSRAEKTIENHHTTTRAESPEPSGAIGRKSLSTNNKSNSSSNNSNSSNSNSSKKTLSTPSSKKPASSSASSTPNNKKRKFSESNATNSSSSTNGTSSNSTHNTSSSNKEPLLTSSGSRADADMPIHPDEPTYCICNRVSFGEMIGCDNPDCPIEWFHFECVGLTASPKGKKWYCPICTEAAKTANKRQKTS